MSTETAVGPVRFSGRKVGELLKFWALSLTDGVLGYLLLVSMGAFYISISDPQLAILFYLDSLSVNPLAFFYAVLAAFFYGAVTVLVILPDNWFGERGKIDDRSGLSNYVLRSFEAITSGLYSASIVLGSAAAAYWLTVNGYTLLSMWALIAIPILDLYLLREFKTSVLAMVTISVAMLLAYIILIVALLHYTYHRYPEASERFKVFAGELFKILMESVGPKRGSFLGELRQLRGRRGHGLK